MKNKILLIMGILILGLCCFLAWHWWQDRSALPEALQSTPTMPAVPPKPKAEQKKETSVPSEEQTAFPTAGKVGVLTALQAQIQEEELRARLKELQGDTLSPVVVPIVSAPTPPPTPLEPLPTPAQSPASTTRGIEFFHIIQQFENFCSDWFSKKLLIVDFPLPFAP